jgi:hypothetical protein
MSNEEEDLYKPIDCLICYDVHPIEDIVSLECDHMFGRECMAEFLKSKILDNLIDRIECPMDKCGKEITY